MKKEYVIIAVIAMFILSQVIDWVTGPINIYLQNPFSFLKYQVISTYPFTTLSVILKIIVTAVSILMFLSFLAEKQLAKSVFLVFLSALFELYAIQQVATGSRMISLPWSLSLAFSGVLLLLPATFYAIIGLIRLLHRQVTKEPYDKVTSDSEEPDI